MKREKLIALRGNRTLTATAQILGITRQMLGAIEKGERTPSLNLAKKISSHYGASMEELFFNDNRHKTFPKSNPTGTEG
ncbi:MAG TPA: transcriptional regulator [Syntrophomonas sp.]|jgi:putative transcriptional regulator|nr:transcriptional regulator [Syntrophomonas sp.]